MPTITPTHPTSNSYEIDFGEPKALTSLSFKTNRVPAWTRIKAHDGNSYQPAALVLATGSSFNPMSKPTGFPKSLLLNYIGFNTAYQPGCPTKQLKELTTWTAVARPYNMMDGVMPFASLRKGTPGSTWSGTFTGNNLTLGLVFGHVAGSMSVSIDGGAPFTVSPYGVGTEFPNLFPYGPAIYEQIYAVSGSGTHTVTLTVTSGEVYCEYVGVRTPDTASWYPVLAWMKNGVPTAWTHDGMSSYYWGANATKTAVQQMSTSVYKSIQSANQTRPQYLAKLNQAIAELKAMNPALDQDYVLPVFPSYDGGTGLWGTLTASEIAAFNALGAGIDTGLADVPLYFETTAHLTAIQRAFITEAKQLFTGYEHIRFGGINLYNETPTATAGYFATAAVKSWLNSQGCFIIGHDWSKTTTAPASWNADVLFEMPNVNFKPATETPTGFINAMNFAGAAANRGLNHEVNPFNTGWSAGLFTQPGTWQLAADGLGAFAIARQKGAAICHYFSHLVALLAGADNAACREMYDNYCAMMLDAYDEMTYKSELYEGATTATTYTLDVGRTASKFLVEFDASTTGSSWSYEESHDLDVFLNLPSHDLDVFLNLPPVTTEHTVTVSKSGEGTVSPLGAVTVLEGSLLTVTFAPAAGHQLEAVIVDGSPVGNVLTGPDSIGRIAGYSFANVTEAHTIEVVFGVATGAFDWSQSHEDTFEYIRVDARTLQEGEALVGISPGGSISENLNTTLKASGSLEMVGDLDIRDDLIRIYLTARSDTATVRLPLGTFFASTPRRSVSDVGSTATVDLYSLLLQLDEDAVETTYTVPAGTNAITHAAGLVTGAGLAVNATPSASVTTTAAVFEAGTSKLEIINNLLEYAGYSSAYVDGMGTVMMTPYTNPSTRQPVWTFEDGDNSIFLPEVEDELDWFSTPNVVIVVCSNADTVMTATAVNDDPASPYSTVSRGRRIVRREEVSDIETQSALDAKAAELLESSSSAVQTASLTHTFAPYTIGDVVRLNYQSADIDYDMAAQSRELTLSSGVPTSASMRRFVRG